jgi:nucleoid-associated protein YgaU
VINALSETDPLPLFPSSHFCLKVDAMPDYYLLKTEPSEYSFADLQRDKATVWDGVSNPVALRNLREMKPGAQLIVYETAAQKSAVGTAKVISVDISDPKKPQIKIQAGKARTSSSPIPLWFGRAGSRSSL